MATYPRPANAEVNWAESQSPVAVSVVAAGRQQSCSARGAEFAEPDSSVLLLPRQVPACPCPPTHRCAAPGAFSERFANSSGRRLPLAPRRASCDGSPAVPGPSRYCSKANRSRAAS